MAGSGSKVISNIMPLKRLRLAKGWSQARLSGISGVTTSKIGALEQNIPGIYLGMHLRTLCKLAMALDAAPVDIMPFLGARPRTAEFYNEVSGSLVMEVRGDRRSE